MNKEWTEYEKTLRLIRRALLWMCVLFSVVSFAIIVALAIAMLWLVR